MTTGCEGCRLYRKEGTGVTCLVYQIERISETEECPCVTCLIKGICQDACERFQEYSKIVNYKTKSIQDIMKIKARDYLDEWEL